MQICTLTQTHNHANIPSLSFLQAGCPSCSPTNSVKALKAWTKMCVNYLKSSLLEQMKEESQGCNLEKELLKLHVRVRVHVCSSVVTVNKSSLFVAHHKRLQSLTDMIICSLFQIKHCFAAKIITVHVRGISIALACIHK